jgi:hypothetical protein
MHEADIGKFLLADEAARGLPGEAPDGSSAPVGNRRVPEDHVSWIG